ncbi:hypothetical protein EDD17DRAFT_1695665 [Pisolithus thermaeus]|nr:hypothetical protein EDD17DRAFT_1695665 [Pisolithus thermaeus]
MGTRVEGFSLKQEFRDDQSMGTLGEVFIRCNNILCIGSAIRGTVMYAYRRCRPRSTSRSPQYRSLVCNGVSRHSY